MSRFSLLRSDRQAPATGKARSDFAGDENFIADTPAAKRSARQKETPDPALPEKKRARRRLVGAITLTLAAVITLPLVFDSEPKHISQDISIDVPARSKPNPAVATPTVQEAAQAPLVPAAPVAAAAVAGAAAAAAANARSAPAEAVKPAAAVQQAAKPAAETKPAASEQGKLIVQVAALASQQKAAELQAKLKSAGIVSHIQKVNTQDGQRMRVRIGPLASKKEADGVCAKLDKMRLQCTLVPA